MSAAVSHQNQFQKQSLQNMLIHADRCSTAVTTGRLWCLAEGFVMGIGKVVDRVSSSKSGEGWSFSGEEKRGQRRKKMLEKYNCK